MEKIVRYPAYPAIIPTSDNKLVLDKTYQVKNIRIPINFKSDGLTLKYKFFRLFVNRFEPKFAPFYFLHDYLCKLEKYKLADELGKEVLFEIEKSWRTKAMIKLVVAYHKLNYKYI